jgi:hypothetical protein
MTEEDRTTFTTGAARLQEITTNQARIKTANTWLQVAAIIAGLVAAILTPFIWFAGIPFAAIAGGCMLTTFALNCKAKSMAEEAQAIQQTNTRLIQERRQALFQEALEATSTGTDGQNNQPPPDQSESATE